MLRFLKDPFVQFVALGMVIFTAYMVSRPVENINQDKRIVIDRSTQEWIYANFKKQFGRVPSRMEMGALIKAHIESEVKYREALTMGMDEQDSIVRRRMMQKFDFLFGNAAAGVLPEETNLEDWYDSNSAEFTEPPRITFEHIWFSPDNRGRDTEKDATAALESISKGEPVQGDRFPYEVRFHQATPGEVRNVLGPEFANVIFNSPLNKWSGPLKSGLGYHLVNVSEVIEENILPLADVREEAVQLWREFESDRLLDELVTNLISQFEVELDESALMQFEYEQDEQAELP